VYLPRILARTKKEAEVYCPQEVMDQIYNQGILAGFISGVLITLLIGGLALLFAHQAKWGPFKITDPNTKKKD
jgi:F0F1-type ATP synthase assembly protein I